MDLVEREMRASPTERVAALIGENGQQPVAYVRRVAALTQAFEAANQGSLDKVHRLVGVTHHSEGEPKHAALVALHQSPIGFRIAGQHRRDHFGI